MPPPKLVDLRKIKKLVGERLKPGSAVRELILREPDFLAASTYAERAPQWLVLLNLEEVRV